MKDKVILAYSGGLDTSVMLKWLVNKNYDVIAFVADVGQNEDFNLIKEKALKTGASKVYIKDLKKELVEKYIFEMLKANAIYEGKYLLGTAIARPIIAKKQVEIAKKENISINQFIASAVSEKMAAFTTVEYLEERAKNVNDKKYLKALSKVADVEPDDYDKL